MSGYNAAERRIQKELMSMMRDPPIGISMETPGTNVSEWIVKLVGPEGTLYAGELFTLQFRFGPNYPFESPEVMFTGVAPVHPHVYSNGHICLSILADDWSPALTAEGVCLSIISMLSSCKEKKQPPDNAHYVKTCSKSPKKTKWWFHDDTV